MIFVTVGNHYQGFERLVRKMDEIAGRIDEKVIMQIGTTEYKPVNAEYFSFIESFEEIEKLNKEARVVVSHAGVGSILTALEQGTPVIIVPRLKKFDEHMDDHQLEIAEALSQDQKIKVIQNIEDIEAAILKEYKDSKDSKKNETLINNIKNYLTGLKNE